MLLLIIHPYMDVSRYVYMSVYNYRYSIHVLLKCLDVIYTVPLNCPLHLPPVSPCVLLLAGSAPRKLHFPLGFPWSTAPGR